MTPEYRELYGIIADGVAEENILVVENVPFEDRNQKWLPELNVLRTIPVVIRRVLKNVRHA